jgi:hypothetical protein
VILIDTNARQIAKALEQIPASQLPFARSLIANRMAQKVRRNEISVMKSRLDRPTPWTLNSPFLDPATKRDPRARVWFKDFAPKGAPAGEYLKPEVFSGDRKQKRSERALIAMGFMGKSQYLVPASGAKKDAFGNVPRGEVVKILSQLRAFGEQGYQANATQSRRSRRKSTASRYFFGEIEGSMGVWMKVKSAFGEGVKPVLLVSDGSPKYRIQFPFFAVAENTIAANYERIGIGAINEALSTARPS